MLIEYPILLATSSRFAVCLSQLSRLPSCLACLLPTNSVKSVLARLPSFLPLPQHINHLTPCCPFSQHRVYVTKANPSLIIRLTSYSCGFRRLSLAQHHAHSLRSLAVSPPPRTLTMSSSLVEVSLRVGLSSLAGRRVGAMSRSCFASWLESSVGAMAKPSVRRRFEGTMEFTNSRIKCRGASRQCTDFALSSLHLVTSLHNSATLALAREPFAHRLCSTLHRFRFVRHSTIGLCDV